MATTLTDLHSDIIESHILPKLDGPSLFSATAVSKYLHGLGSDNGLWAEISNSTWPSIKHPTVQQLISTFPSGHRSFFNDSFPGLSISTHANSSPKQEHKHKHSSSCDLASSYDPRPTELISAVDIRYKNNVVYSTVQFTDTTSDHFLSSGRIELNETPTCIQSGPKHEPIISTFIDLKVDELAGADEATLSDLLESLTLSWILIDPTRKRAGNFSSIKPVSARKDWTSNATVVKYVTVLPGSDPGDMVRCKIEMVLGVNINSGMTGLHVKQVTLKLEDLHGRRLNGWGFLVFTRETLSEEKNVRRKIMSKEDRLKSWMKFKKMKRDRMEWERMVQEKRRFSIKMNYIGTLVSFCLSLYFLILLIQQ